MTFHMKWNDNILFKLLTVKNPKFKDERGLHYIHLFKLWETKTIQGTDELTLQLDIGKLQSNYSVHTVMMSTIFCWYNHGVQPWYNSPLISLPFPLQPSCTLIQTFCHVKGTATYSKIIISWIFKLQMELFFFFTSRQCTGVWEKIEKLLSKSSFKKWMNKLNFFLSFQILAQVFNSVHFLFQIE